MLDSLVFLFKRVKSRIIKDERVDKSYALVVKGLYPQCAVAIHYHTPMSEALREDLYTQMKSVIIGKKQKEAAALLLHFVQTAFQYKTDGE